MHKLQAIFNSFAKITWLDALILSVATMLLATANHLWAGVQGAYFEHSFQIMLYPFVGYVVWNVLATTLGKPVNQIRLVSMTVGLLILLFVPLVCLMFTGQVDVHSVVSGVYNDDLHHMPYAHLLPVLYFTSTVITRLDVMNGRLFPET